MIFTTEDEIYLREKLSLGHKVMEDLNQYLSRCNPALQQDLTDSIVDIFNLLEAIHYQIDKSGIISQKMQEARIHSARQELKIQELKQLNDELNTKLVRALEG